MQGNQVYKDDFILNKFVTPSSHPELLQFNNKIDTMSSLEVKTDKDNHKNGMKLHRNHGRVRSSIIPARGRATIIA